MPGSTQLIKVTYFVHATTTDNENRIATGWNHGTLSKRGIEEAKNLKSTIGNRSFDLVFCSDLKRAVESAGLLFDGKGIPIIQDDRLRECHYGDLTGGDAKIVESEMITCIDKPFPNGERCKDVEMRIRHFLNEQLVKYPGKQIAIVSHRAPQLAFDVIANKKTWEQAIAEDWRHKKAWQPGWEYVINEL